MTMRARITSSPSDLREIHAGENEYVQVAEVTVSEGFFQRTNYLVAFATAATEIPRSYLATLAKLASDRIVLSVLHPRRPWDISGFRGGALEDHVRAAFAHACVLRAWTWNEDQQVRVEFDDGPSLRIEAAWFKGTWELIHWHEVVEDNVTTRTDTAAQEDAAARILAQMKSKWTR